MTCDGGGLKWWLGLYERHSEAKNRWWGREMKWEINKIFKYKATIAMYICTVTAANGLMWGVFEQKCVNFTHFSIILSLMWVLLLYIFFGKKKKKKNIKHEQHFTFQNTSEISKTTNTLIPLKGPK